MDLGGKLTTSFQRKSVSSKTSESTDASHLRNKKVSPRMHEPEERCESEAKRLGQDIDRQDCDIEEEQRDVEEDLSSDIHEAVVKGEGCVDGYVETNALEPVVPMADDGTLMIHNDTTSTQPFEVKLPLERWCNKMLNFSSDVAYDFVLGHGISESTQFIGSLLHDRSTDLLLQTSR